MVAAILPKSYTKQLRATSYIKDNLAVDVGLEPTRRFRRQFSKLLWLPFHQSTVFNYSKQPESVTN